jgi:MFS family permease
MDESSSAKPRHPWGLAALLTAAMLISFFDRGNLAVAAPVLAPELGLSPGRLGLLLSGFYWTYAAFQLAAGWLVDRIDVRWAYLAGFLVWSFATLSSALAASFTGLLCLRLLLGVGESVTYPASSRILATAFPEERRGRANAMIDMGARLGPALGTLFGALLVARLGWRGLFLVTGSLGLIWLLPWVRFAPSVRPIARASASGPGWKQLLRRRAVWGTCGGLWCANYAWYFLLSWLPSYLVRERHFSLKSMAIWGAAPYLLMAVSSIAGGVLSDRLIARGGAPVRVRKGFLVTGLLLAAAAMPTVLLPRVEWALGGLMLTCLVFGVYASNVWSLSQTLAGAEAAGRWTGFQNAFGNVAGIVAPALTGWIVMVTGQFAMAFVAAGAACLAGAASFWFLVREPEGAGPKDVILG